MSTFSDSYVARVLFAVSAPRCNRETTAARRWRWLSNSFLRFLPARAALHARPRYTKWRNKHGHGNISLSCAGEPIAGGCSKLRAQDPQPAHFSFKKNAAGYPIQEAEDLHVARVGIVAMG